MPVHSLRTHTLAPRSTPVLRSLRFRSEISHIRVNLCSSVVSEVGKIANPQSETGNEKSVAPQRFSQAGRRLIAVACKLRSRPHERRAGRRNGRMTRQPPAGRVAQPASSHSPARSHRSGPGHHEPGACQRGACQRVALLGRAPARAFCVLWLLAVWFVVFPLVVWVARRPVPPTRAALVQPVRWFVGRRCLRASGVCGPASSVGVCPVES